MLLMWSVECAFVLVQLIQPNVRIRVEAHMCECALCVCRYV